MFRVVALCAVLILLPTVASARAGAGSTTWAMSGCRTWVATLDGLIADRDVPTAIKQGFCIGAVNGVNAAHADICAPQGTTLEQLVRVVTQYIDARPARQHERFTHLASEALKATWPCR